MDCLNSKTKCIAFNKLLNKINKLNYGIDFSNGDDCALGFNEKNNNLWIMLDCDYNISIFINIYDSEIQYCWTNYDDGEEHIEYDFEEIYNIASEYHKLN